LRVYPGKRLLDGNWIEPTEEQVKALAEDKERIAILRKRLSNISWFVAALSEYIARRSNHEDQCDGRFFSGRFGCREVESEGGLLIVGLYNDLNQVWAGEVQVPEEAQYSSVWYRIQERLQSADDPSSSTHADWLAPLMLQPDQLGEEIPSATGRRASDKGLLPVTLDQYLAFLDWASRQRRADKRGAVPPELAPIFERLGLAGDELLDAVEKFPKYFPRMAGPVSALVERAKEVGRRWLHGVGPAARIFPQT
jgi:hypothetical protein